MAKNLLIVESPAKAKTIEKILGKDFQVKSCFGHIRDLEKADMGIDINNNYAPRYIVPKDKEKIVYELKKTSKDFTEIWLASDEDREGESISWHLTEVLNLDPQKTKRIVFHEITASAIKKAISHPRIINMNLVNAQQARRILDRLVGFELSPVLWKKIGRMGSLSAGRVQSVAVRLIVDRENEIINFIPSSSFKLEAWFIAKDKNNKDVVFKAEGNKLDQLVDAQKFLQSCLHTTYTVSDMQVKPLSRVPAAPFTTSTLQQEASRKLGYGVSKTMLLAQRLYEAGYISYMRTDSVHLSETALTDIEKQIVSVYGKQYHQARQYKTKNQTAQEAHEAIRPTNMLVKIVDNPDAQRLYDLIWKRTISSQMSDAIFEKHIVKILIHSNQEKLTAEGEVMIFDGFLKAYTEDKDEEEEKNDDVESNMLPPLKINQILPLQEMNAIERFSRASPRYTEASLVKKLEELNIGRPSTYASTISTIIKRTYVEKKDREGTLRTYQCVSLKDNTIETLTKSETTGVEKNKLFPTDLGTLVTKFLSEHFKKIMDYQFTAKIEDEFDEIANGDMSWTAMIDSFYKPFHQHINHIIETADKSTGEKELGIDHKSGKVVLARIGKYGPMVQLGRLEEKEKPKFAKLKPNQSISTITLDEALQLFSLPRTIGSFENHEVVINIGPFGPYALHNKLFYSLSKDMDPYTISIEAIEPLIIEKRNAKKEKTIQVFSKEKIQVLNGPYGPYIKKGLKNYKLSKEEQEKASLLTVEECLQIIDKIHQNPSKRRFKKKSS